MAYQLHQQRLREQLRKFLERQRASGEQYARWNAELALTEPTPRPHMRPLRMAMREARTHYTPPPE